MGVTVTFNGFDFYFSNGDTLYELLDENCDDACLSREPNGIKYDDE